MDAIKEQRLTKQVEDLLTRVEQLEAAEAQFVQEFELQNALIRELNFRILFAMRYFQFGRVVKTGVLDNFGKPIETQERVTLWDIYLKARDTFIEGMETSEQENAGASIGEGGSSAAATANDGQGEHAPRERNGFAVVGGTNGSGTKH